MRSISFKTLTLPAFTLAAMMCAPVANAATCTPTGFVKDAINLTAVLINPPGVVSGDVDATGCNIGVYYSAGHGRVSQANVHGANYFGIVNNGADVDVLDSTVSDIGEKPFNGTQHGVAIDYEGNARGDIQRNFVWDYQKNGIVVKGPSASADIEQNYVVGFGPVNFIAQNGIEAGLGARAKIQQNFVSGNSYTGANLASSSGIILFGGGCYDGAPQTNTEVSQNVAVNNDIGIALVNLDTGCGNPLSTPSKNSVTGNSLFNNALNNVTGNSATQGYQAGVLDIGNADVIKNNDICGPGYTPPGTAAIALFDIDVTFTNNPIVDNNTNCTAPRQHHEWDFDHNRHGHPHD